MVAIYLILLVSKALLQLLPAEISIANTRGPHEIDQTVEDMVPISQIRISPLMSGNLSCTAAFVFSASSRHLG